MYSASTCCPHTNISISRARWRTLPEKRWTSNGTFDYVLGAMCMSMKIEPSPTPRRPALRRQSSCSLHLIRRVRPVSETGDGKSSVTPSPYNATMPLLLLNCSLCTRTVKLYSSSRTGWRCKSANRWTLLLLTFPTSNSSRRVCSRGDSSRAHDHYACGER